MASVSDRTRLGHSMPRSVRKQAVESIRSERGTLNLYEHTYLHAGVYQTPKSSRRTYPAESQALLTTSCEVYPATHFNKPVGSNNAGWDFVLAGFKLMQQAFRVWDAMVE
ncbi:hypothetical protein NXS19_004016 [Fusarium pseudograminearum]|nr:hypothetical protein NXS19_004016 [Fusarium pseudograminearum]